MPKFRKKPVVIEAIEVSDVAIGPALPAWLTDAMMQDVVMLHSNGTITIKTLEGMMTADRDDWIIQGVKGEIYPCKPDIFAATYEPA